MVPKTLEIKHRNQTHNPLSKRGKNNLSNIQILPKANNIAKTDKTRGVINNAGFLVHIKSRDATGYLIGKMKVKK